ETVLKKRNLDAFRKGRIFEDMAKVSMPAYEHTENGLPRFYPSVPQQHNGSVKNTSNNSLNITSLDNDIM
ncbi:hypothetical protein S83_058715, partial [Arachis hypogaea]